MEARVPHRSAESQAVDGFLTSAATRPSALVLEGEAGIGKTTVWLAAVEEARRRGVAVLSAQPSAAEVSLAHASIADLLRAVSADRFSALPPPQRLAVGRVLQAADADDGATDLQAIGAALLSIVQGLAVEGSVLLAVDDAQWLDASSAAVVAFVARRLSGPVGLLVTARTRPDDSDPVPWLRMARPEAVTRTTVQPLGHGALRTVLGDRLGRTFSPSSMTRIHDVSRGNPFYALELGRAAERSHSGAAPLTATLTDLVRARVGEVGDQLHDLLLVTASLAEPTVELVQAACRLVDGRALALVEEAEARGLLAVDGHRLRFSHPLLAAGVLGDARPARRREVHGRLAAVVDEPEERARHLALAAVRGDPATLEALDAAAVLARTRGAPAAAAELLELAVGLGGSTPERRLQAALHHFDAGDTERARRDLENLARDMLPGTFRARATSLLGLVRLHDDSFSEAAALLEESLAEVEDDLRLRTQILIWLSYAEVNAGRLAPALEHAAAGVHDGERLADRELLSQAVVLRATLRFIRGDGVDEPELLRGLRLEGDTTRTPVPFRAVVQEALLRAWTGQLDIAATSLRTIRKACVDHGEENHLVFLDFHSALVDIWRGDLAGASVIAEESMERALQLNGDVPLAVARSLRGMVATYVGNVVEARTETAEALEIYRRCGWSTLAGWPIATLGLLYLSTGEYLAAVTALEPLLAGGPDLLSSPEIITSGFVPDAVEAFVQLGRLDEADEWLEPFQRAGRRHDRPWTLATAGRARAMLLAARGDLDAASIAAEEAMAQHDRVPMPFERARTQLLLGQLQRRRRKKEPAATAFAEALRTFEGLGTELWAARARAELSRVSAGASAGADLTPTERRVAELAAEGMTNREVAAELFISPKTVETNLGRVYRKLDIRSRAELGRLMGSPRS